MFPTSVDRVDDFIYRVYLVPEEFRRFAGKGDAPEERGGALRAAPHLVWAGRMGPTS